MNRKAWIMSALAIYGITAWTLWSGPASRADDPKKNAKPGDKAAVPDPQETEKMMTQMAAPCEQHDYIKPLEGKWKTVAKMRWTPDSPWDESNGIMENRMVLGGRWLQMDFKGSNNGKPFNGMGYFGYDKGMKKYVGTWMDTMSTTMMVNYGDADDAHKAFTLKGEMLDTQTGQMMRYKTVTSIVGKDKSTYQMFFPSPDGKGEFVCLDITYTKM